jgi:hypothetical protein
LFLVIRTIGQRPDHRAASPVTGFVHEFAQFLFPCGDRLQAINEILAAINRKPAGLGDVWANTIAQGAAAEHDNHKKTAKESKRAVERTGVANARSPACTGSYVRMRDRRPSSNHPTRHNWFISRS